MTHIELIIFEIDAFARKLKNEDFHTLFEPKSISSPTGAPIEDRCSQLVGSNVESTLRRLESWIGARGLRARMKDCSDQSPSSKLGLVTEDWKQNVQHARGQDVSADDTKRACSNTLLLHVGASLLE